MALTDKREIRERAGNVFVRGVAANVTIHQGALVCNSAAGHATPGATATTLTALGVAEESVTGAGVAGVAKVRIKRGTFLFKNKADDLVTSAEIGKPCYVVEDETVAKTDGTGTRSKAGIVHDVEDSGVWVRF